MTEPSPFGARLRRHRSDAGMTREELASRSGVSVRALGDLERGRSRVPQRRTVEALVSALGLTGAAATDLRQSARARRALARPAASLAPPRTVADFTGRDAELRWLGDLMTRGGPGAAGEPGSGASQVAVISGTAGLGKTTIALEAASRYAASFPDGVHFLDLRGLDPDPPTPTELLGRLLAALGTDAAEVSGDLAARSAQYRALVRDRRCLVLLDNAADEAQVRPLLPGAGASMTVVTSRRGMAGLEAVHRLQLRVLPPGEAVALLRRIVGAERIAAEPDAPLRGLVEACGGLPLALRIAGNRLLTRPDWTVAYLLRELTDPDRRMELLVAGDLQVAGPFLVSYRQLSEPARRTFRRLALVPGPDCDVELVGQVTGSDPSKAAAALEELVESGLLQPAADGRYRFHDLIRLFARARLRAEEPADERERVASGMVTWLLDRAIAAGRWFEPVPSDGSAGSWPGSSSSSSSSSGAGHASAVEAERWIMRESANWLGALRSAAEAGRHREVMAVADAMHWFSDRWIHWGRWREVFDLGAAAARAGGDASAQAVHLNYLSWAYTMCERRPDLGVAPAQEALVLARAAGDRRQQGWAHLYLSSAARQIGEVTRAESAARASLELFEAAPDWDGFSQGLSLLARSQAVAGRHREAITQYERLRALLSDPDRAPSPQVRDLTAGQVELYIGFSLLALRRWAPAAARFRDALPLLRRAGLRQVEARCRYGWGQALVHLNRWEEAREQLRRAVRMSRQVGLPNLAGQALDALAGLEKVAGRRPGRG